MTPRLPPGFDAPWQAQLFALTVALADAGHFSWGDWTQAFGATLERLGAVDAPDGSADYHAAWLETLESLLDQSGLAPRAETRLIKAGWTAAYLKTPHGQPVKLE